MLKIIEIILKNTKTKETVPLLIIPYNKNGANKLPVSTMMQIENILHSSDAGIEEVKLRMEVECNLDKKEEILLNLEILRDENILLRNFHNLSLEMICVCYYRRKHNYNDKLIAHLLGFQKLRTIKTILGYREEKMKLSSLAEFQEEWDDKYGYLNDETINAMAEIIKKEVKNAKKSYKHMA